MPFQMTLESFKRNLLIVDDEPTQLQTLGDILTDEGFAVSTCTTFDEAILLSKSEPFAVAILDLQLLGHNGIELLSTIKESQPDIRTIIHTGFGSFDSAKDAINLGAFAYVEKCGDPVEIVRQANRAVEDRLSQEISRSETRYRDLLDDSGVIVWECELPDRRFTFVNQLAETLLGYSVSHWIDSPDFWHDHIHVEDRERVVKYSQEQSALGKDHEFDYRAKTFDGRIVWLHAVIRIVSDFEQQRPIRLRGVLVDITERMTATQKLTESEERYRRLVDNSPLCIHEIELNGTLSTMNAAGLKMMEVFNEDEIRGTEYLCVICENDRTRIGKLLNEACQGKSSSFAFRSVNGRYFESCFAPLFDDNGGVCRIMGITQDISERIVAEKSLQTSESKFRTIFEQAAVGVALLNSDSGVFLQINRRYSELLSAPGDSAIGKTWMELTHPNDLEVDLAKMRELRSGEIREFTIEKRLQRNDGSFVWVNLTVSPTWQPGEEPSTHIAIVNDITDRKQAEEEIQQFDMAVENAMQGISRLDRDGIFVMVKPQYARMLGYTPDELEGKSWEITVPAEDLPKVGDGLKTMLDVGRAEVECKALRKDGSSFQKQILLVKTFDESDKHDGHFCFMRDVTEIMRLREKELQLEHVSRLSTMGEMVAGIAHEIRQPLNAISNFAIATSVTLRDFNNKEVIIELLGELAEWNQEISKASNRASEIVERLRRYVSKSEQPRQITSLHSLIRESVDLLAFETRQNQVSITVELPDDLPNVVCDPIQIQQVLVNLLHNANEALSQQVGPRTVELSAQQKGESLVVRVADNGPGIAEELHSQLFHAFFTTKPDGLGMGLAITNTIIEAHDGRIWVTSNIDDGSTFHFKIPLSGPYHDVSLVAPQRTKELVE